MNYEQFVETSHRSQPDFCDFVGIIQNLEPDLEEPVVNSETHIKQSS